jgi:predicted nucleic acid-binding Zn ribbon protein
MYCSRCSASISEDLNFCSSCGERVDKTGLAETSKKQSEMLDNLAITLIFVGGGGMLFLVGLIAVLLDKTIPNQVVVLLAGMYIAAWFGICFKLLGQISKLVDANLEDRRSQRSEAASPVEISAKTTAQLEEHFEPAVSVTEHTTRNLEKVPVK